MNAWQIWWHANGRWGWLCAALVIMTLAIVVGYQPISLQWVDHGTRQIGAVEVRLETWGRFRPGHNAELRISTNRVFTGELRIGNASQPIEVTASLEIDFPVAKTARHADVFITANAATAHWQMGRMLDTAD
ncbi:MAG: hypothetical protein AAF529_24370 [Pseudomonadota bacterium]